MNTHADSAVRLIALLVALDMPFACLEGKPFRMVRNPWCPVTEKTETGRTYYFRPSPSWTSAQLAQLHEILPNNSRDDLSEYLTQVNFWATASIFCHKLKETCEKGGTMAGTFTCLLTENHTITFLMILRIFETVSP